MSGSTRFCVITAAYNAQDTLRETIDSVRAQTLGDWEYVIVDDGSSDDTWSILSEYARLDERITVVKQENSGAATARNHAASLATAPFLVILDSDDMLLPEYLAAQAAFIDQHPGYGIYSCNGLNLRGGHKSRIWCSPRFRSVTSFSLKEMLNKCLIFVMAVVSRSEFEAVGGFRVESWVEDYDLWLRMLAHGSAHLYNPAELGIYRLTDGSKSTQAARINRGVIESLHNLAREYPDVVRGPAYDSALGVWHARLSVAEIEERLAQGDARGVRRQFLSIWRAAHLPSIRRTVGPLAMSLSPQLYRAIFLRRTQRSEA